MSNTLNSNCSVWAIPVPGTTNQWSGQGTLDYGSEPIRVNLIPINVYMNSGYAAFPYGTYTATYSGTDANLTEYPSTASPSTYTLDASNASLPMPFNCSYNLPANATSPYIASPLKVKITITGGGGTPGK